MKTKIFSALVLFAMLFTVCVAAGEFDSDFADYDIPRVVDNADLISDEEETALTEEIENSVFTHEYDCVILTLNSLDGNDAKAYADEYYKDGGYGFGSYRRGVIFLISMEEREWRFTAFEDNATIFFTQSVHTEIENDVVPHLSSGDYYSAFLQFVNDISYYVSSDGSAFTDAYPDGYINQYVDEYNPSKNSSQDTFSENLSTSLIIGFAAALIISVIVLIVMIVKMNTAVKQHSANQYLNQSSVRLTSQSDTFLYSTVTKTAIPKDNGSSGGFSSGHSFSGGSSSSSGGHF